MTMQLQAPPQYRLLVNLANRISAREGFTVTKDEATDWLRVTYLKRTVLVSAEYSEKDGWYYKWGNARRRRAPVHAVTEVDERIATLLMEERR